MGTALSGRAEFGDESFDSHQFHAGGTCNPVEPARLLSQLQIAAFHRITLTVAGGMIFAAHKP
jgi:hypothetical protein